MRNRGIQIQDLVVGYGRRVVLQGIDLCVPEGETTVLLGRNGEGKSTLLATCLGLLRPRAGVVLVAGLDPHRQPAQVRARVGYVPDRPDVWPWMTARELLRYLGAHVPQVDVARGLRLLERLDVAADLRFSRLSRGQGMKAMLATSLAHDPEVLLLDEPFGGLDALARDEVLRSVIQALGERPRTVLLTTHDLEVAIRIADHVAVLANGRIAEGDLASAPHDSEEALTPRRLEETLAAASVRHGEEPTCVR